MRKNNLFNRIFHKKEVEATQAEAIKKEELIVRRENLVKELRECTTLQEVLNLHKRIWNLGYQYESIGPCPYGMFRTKDITNMKPEEVFLGGIWGLFTKNISFWEENKDEKYGANGFGLNPELSLYDMILKQYKNHLISNINAIAHKAGKDIEEYNTNGYGKVFSRI